MGELRIYRDAAVIITGGASGIGKAVGEELASRGADVVLADIDDAEPVAAAIRARGGKASAARLDVTRADDVKALVDRTIAAKGRLDFIFNNAGIAVGGGVEDCTLESWRKIVDVNLMGVVHGVHAAFPAMLAQGFGHIVNTASTAGLLPTPGATSYSTTKHAVVGLTRGLRAEGAARGVRASAVCPGAIRTPILRGGRHGILLGKAPEAVQREVIGELFEQLRPMDPAAFARRLADCVAKNQAIIVIPGWWKLVWWLERLLPSLIGYVARTAHTRNRALLEQRAKMGSES
jgi:NAD(P)-dependent dehydrogenase (short-subunit alcohol dehydrogenase family)